MRSSATLGFSGGTLLLSFMLATLSASAAAAGIEYYSSIDSIQLLNSVEVELLQYYRQYFATQQAEFQLYRNFIANVKAAHALALEDVESYLGNPINAFALIKRVVNEWAGLYTIVKQIAGANTLQAQLKTIDEQLQPDAKELQGAARGLARLQRVYNLTSDDLALGIINGVDYGTGLSTRDCVEIGANLFDIKDYILSIDWMKLAVRQLAPQLAEATNNAEESFTENVKNNRNVAEKLVNNNAAKKDIESGRDDRNQWIDDSTEGLKDTDTYAKVEYYEDLEKQNYEYNDNDFEDVEPTEATDYDEEQQQWEQKTQDAKSSKLKKEPNLDPSTDQAEHASLPPLEDSAQQKLLLEALEYLSLAHYQLNDITSARFYSTALIQISTGHSSLDAPEIVPPQRLVAPLATPDFSTYSNYTQLCRGIQQPEPMLHKLRCALETRPGSIYMLAPIKMEQLSLEPPITMYYELLGDTHIENIVAEADALMKRSQVLAKEGSSGVTDETRVSQQAALRYTSPSMQQLSRVTNLVTGMDMNNVEGLQMANYGIGGQYDPHYDFFGEQRSVFAFEGDRISTNIFYLSNVEQGGYTVFPKVNVFARPVKGGMVVWYNLHKSLEVDVRTLHAGCPVIKGTKRIGNVWIHSTLQEFRRPCELENDGYKSAAYLWDEIN